jgi:hypothetical protein
MDKLARKIVKLAYEKPELRRHLLPLLKDETRSIRASDEFNKAVGDKKVKSPDTGNDVKIKSLSGGGSKSKALYQKLKKEWSEKQKGGKGGDKSPKGNQKEIEKAVGDLTDLFGGGEVSKAIGAIGGPEAAKAMKGLSSLSKQFDNLGGLFNSKKEEGGLKGKTKALGNAITDVETASKSLTEAGKKGKLSKKEVTALSRALSGAISQMKKLDSSLSDSEKKELGGGAKALGGGFEKSVKSLMSSLDELKKMV